MKMKASFNDRFKGLKVNANKAKGHGVYPVILGRTRDQLMSLQSYHSRITIVRLDLHFSAVHTPNHKHENTMLSRYIRKCKADLGSNDWSNHKRFIHGWVKEVGKAENAHYHLFFGFQTLQRNLGLISGDGHTGMWKLFECRWQELTGGTVQFIRPHFLKRDDKQAFAECFEHLSYLAKIRDKHFGTGETYRRFGFSKLSFKEKELTVLEELM
jgi:hypothetical protein